MYPPQNSPAPVQQPVATPAASAPIAAPPAPIQQQQQQFTQPIQQQQFIPPAPEVRMPHTPPGAGAPGVPATPPPQPTAPVQQQQQASPFEQVYQNLARMTGQSPETFRNFIKDDPSVMSGVIADAFTMQQKADLQRQQINVPVQQQQQATQQQPNGEIPLPAAVERYLKTNPQTGMVEPVHPSFQQYADIANHNAMIRASTMQEFQKDPTSLFKMPQVQQAINEQVKAQVNAAVEQTRIQALRESVREKYAKEIAVHDANGQILIDPMEINKPDPKPLLNPLGRAFSNWANRLHQQGMRESHELYETAMRNAKFDLGMLAPPQQQQQQQQGQQWSPTAFMQGTPMQPTNGVAPQQQPWSPVAANQPAPSLAQVLQMQQQGLQQQQMHANSFWPGQAAQRPASYDPGMTVEGALLMAIQDVPDGQNMGAYFDRLGPKLFA